MCPEFKDKCKSIERAEAVLSEIGEGAQVDLIVLPEMALIGYRFDDREDISPYVELVPTDLDSLLSTIDEAEDASDIPCSFKWAFKVSKKFSPAWVAVGFAEKDAQDNYHNSALVVNHELRICHVVRKVLQFDDDKKWANLESSISGIEYNW